MDLIASVFEHVFILDFDLDMVNSPFQDSDIPPSIYLVWSICISTYPFSNSLFPCKWF